MSKGITQEKIDLFSVNTISCSNVLIYVSLIMVSIALRKTVVESEFKAFFNYESKNILQCQM